MSNRLPGHFHIGLGGNVEIIDVKTNAALRAATVTVISAAYLGKATLEVSPQAPKLGEKLLCYLCSPDRLEAALGDQEQEFTRLTAKFGVTHARRVYYWRVICIAGDAVLRLLERVASLKGKFGL